jgi:sugar phosphate isomerase/epimerase
MSFASSLEKGASLSFAGRFDPETLTSYAKAGLSCCELSFSYDYYFNTLDFPKNASACGKLAHECGISLWSLHIPFSQHLDISNEDNELRSITLYTNKTLIKAAAEAGISVIVLHPSSEPISAEKRQERMKRSHEAISVLNSVCTENGLRLAVEDLPRTCLCNNSAEMISLLQGTGAGVVFDTNHSLVEDNPHFIDALSSAGIPIHTLHVSDYYRDENGKLDERHCLPGEGINDWDAIFASLEKAGYCGPLMYEVYSLSKGRKVPLTIKEVYDNMQRF